MISPRFCPGQGRRANLVLGRQCLVPGLGPSELLRHFGLCFHPSLCLLLGSRLGLFPRLCLSQGLRLRPDPGFLLCLEPGLRLVAGLLLHLAEFGLCFFVGFRDCPLSGVRLRLQPGLCHFARLCLGPHPSRQFVLEQRLCLRPLLCLCPRLLLPLQLFLHPGVCLSLSLEAGLRF